MMNINDYGMYSKNAGGHGTPGLRCKCAPAAGIFTDAEWGIYGIDRSKLNKKEKNIVETLEKFDGLYLLAKEAGEEPHMHLVYAIKELIRGLREAGEEE